MSNNLLVPVVLAGVVGIPYLFFRPSARDVDDSLTARGQLSSAYDGLDYTNGTPISESPILFPGSSAQPDFSATPLEFLPISELGSLFGFEVSPQTVTRRWGRVSVSDTIAGLRQYRVALVTGTGPSDIHGCLSYSFDRRQTLQRIHFRGWTGNPEALVRLLTEEFGFARQPSIWEGVYIQRYFGSEIGALVIKHPEIVSDRHAYQTCAILLELNRPKGTLVISEETRQTVRLATVR